tara:strand:+ start:102 stop:497 length:396 start_codon:yes stop_codon:yes gene_type:complete
MERLPNLIIVSVNVLSQFLFQSLAQDEGHLTKSLINMEITRLNFYMQFLNLGIGSVLIDNNFTGFNVNWYMNSGVYLMQTMIINIGSSSASEFGIMIPNLFERWKDRGFSLTLQKGEIGVKTKLLKQEELN